jgi:hypothetical protein
MTIKDFNQNILNLKFKYNLLKDFNKINKKIKVKLKSDLK